MDICLIALLLYTGPTGLLKAPADSVPDEGSLLGLQTAAFSVRPPMAVPGCVCVCVRVWHTGVRCTGRY